MKVFCSREAIKRGTETFPNLIVTSKGDVKWIGERVTPINRIDLGSAFNQRSKGIVIGRRKTVGKVQLESTWRRRRSVRRGDSFVEGFIGDDFFVQSLLGSIVVILRDRRRIVGEKSRIREGGLEGGFRRINFLGGACRLQRTFRVRCRLAFRREGEILDIGVRESIVGTMRGSSRLFRIAGDRRRRTGTGTTSHRTRCFGRGRILQKGRKIGESHGNDVRFRTQKLTRILRLPVYSSRNVACKDAEPEKSELFSRSDDSASRVIQFVEPRGTKSDARLATRRRSSRTSDVGRRSLASIGHVTPHQYRQSSPPQVRRSKKQNH